MEFPESFNHSDGLVEALILRVKERTVVKIKKRNKKRKIFKKEYLS